MSHSPLINKNQQKNSLSICKARFWLVFTKDKRTCFVHTRLRYLKEIKFTTKINEKTLELTKHKTLPKVYI